MTRASTQSRAQERYLFRRARSLVAFWEGREFIVENYLTGKQTRISPLVGHILKQVESYQSKEAILESCSSVPGAAELVDKLVAQDILIRKSTARDTQENLLENTWAWGQDARFFHYSSRRVAYEGDIELQQVSLGKLARGSPPPPPFKDYTSRLHKLPGRFTERHGEFWDVLRLRRTRRRFSGRPVSLSEFSSLLLWTWGHTRFVADSIGGPYLLKTSPSGGARHPIEVYPVVLRVDGVKPGIYHYSVRHHALEWLCLGNFRDLVVRLCWNQEWVRDAAAVFFMTALLGRTMWKYRQSYAYHLDDRLGDLAKNTLDHLASVKRSLVAMDELDLADVRKCLKVVKSPQIRGLGYPGASGLLALIFKEWFGTVDRRVVESLCEIESLPERGRIREIDARLKSNKDWEERDAVLLIDIMRRKARKLSGWFGPDKWTPRKIDMILWTFRNGAPCGG